MKDLLKNMYISAALLNDRNVLDALKAFGPYESLLDVGCWDGEKTLELGRVASAKNLLGIEPITSAAKKAREKDIKTFVLKADTETWDVKSNSIDCIVSNQVVEHLSDLDHFFKESSRVLKKGGHIITSTNNLSSWHNIFSLVLGFAPFDLTNCSSKVGGLGNPFALHRNESDSRGSSWTHKCIYTSKWLTNWQEIYGLETIKIYGAGYYPLPATVGKVFKKHSAFITILAKKL